LGGCRQRPARPHVVQRQVDQLGMAARASFSASVELRALLGHAFGPLRGGFAFLGRRLLGQAASAWGPSMRLRSGRRQISAQRQGVASSTSRPDGDQLLAHLRARRKHGRASVIEHDYSRALERPSASFSADGLGSIQRGGLQSRSGVGSSDMHITQHCVVRR